MFCLVMVDLCLRFLVDDLVFICKLLFFLIWAVNNTETLQHLLFYVATAMDCAGNLLLKREEFPAVTGDFFLHYR